MKQSNKSQFVQWQPNKPASPGAVAYHKAVAYASWHKDNIHEMIRLVKRHVEKGDVVVDYGAGTGSSALYVLPAIPGKHVFMLVDNSPSWLTHAYELFHTNPTVKFLLLKKGETRLQILEELVGVGAVDHVFCANTVHLIQDIDNAFKGIYGALKNGGTFTFQSGNIKRTQREKGILMIDDSVNEVHDIAISIIRSDPRFKKYLTGLQTHITQEQEQRRFVFPKPRPISFYVKQLKVAGFIDIETSWKKIEVRYSDWLEFLLVKRLQAGILPEIGGIDPTPKEEKDRDMIITKASQQLFKQLKRQNPLASKLTFTTEWTYVQAKK